APVSKSKRTSAPAEPRHLVKDSTTIRRITLRFSIITLNQATTAARRKRSTPPPPSHAAFAAYVPNRTARRRATRSGRCQRPTQAPRKWPPSLLHRQINAGRRLHARHLDHNRQIAVRRVHGNLHRNLVNAAV